MIKKKKGFTLVELLSVIVVLAIILAIAIPSILGVINNSKIGNFKSIAKMMASTAKTIVDSDVSKVPTGGLHLKLTTEDLEMDLTGKSMYGTPWDSTSSAVYVTKIGSVVTYYVVLASGTVASGNRHFLNCSALTIEENSCKVETSDTPAVTYQAPIVINYKVYGLAWDGNTTFTRINDAATLTTTQVGVGTGAATNNFDTAEIYSEMTEVTDSGNVYIKIPKFYIKKTVNGDAWTWQISKKRQDNNYYLPACFVDANGNVLPYILVGKYNASLSSGKLESISGKAPLVSTNITTFRNFAKANGAGYQLLDVHVWDVIQTLFYIEFSALDSQDIMQGFTTGQYNAAHTVSSVAGNTITLNTGGTNYVAGQTIDVGTSLGGRQIARNLRITNVSGNAITYETVAGISEMLGTIVGNNIVYNVAYLNGTTNGVTAKSGSMLSNSNGKYAMRYRGIENIYGNIWQFIDGINIQADRQAYVAKNADDYAVNKFDNGYVITGYTNAATNEFVIKMGYDSNNPFIQLPTIVGTLGNSKYKDYYNQNTGNTIALVGGTWDNGSTAGLSCWALYFNSGITSFNIGSRLIKKPL